MERYSRRDGGEGGGGLAEVEGGRGAVCVL